MSRRASGLPAQRRAEFIGGAALGAAAAAGAVVVGAPMLARSAAAGDVRGLNLLLLLERVQATFHRQAADAAVADGDLQTYLELVATQDLRHADALVDELGAEADPEPTVTFDDAMFASPRGIAMAAGDLKDIAVAGYNGQIGNLSVAGAGLAARLVGIDARHAGWIRTLEGPDAVAPQATDPGADEAAVRARLRDRGVALGG